MSSDLGQRVLIAVPLGIFAIIIVTQGGEVFAVGCFILGVLAMSELYTMMRRARPVDIAGYATLAALLALALYEERADVLIALVAAVPLVFVLAITRERLDRISFAFATTLFGVVWIGLALTHAVFLRELQHGDGLLIDVLVATFLGDTAAYVVGRNFGRTPLAPDLSPNKTVEGTLGGVVGATLVFWCAGLYQDWMPGLDALLLGFLVGITAPIGDLFESAIKRDLGVKDTSSIFGAHGGVLDRLDAVFFTVPLTFYVALGLGYG